MTISSSTFKNQYTGNGSNTIFAYGFKIFNEDDISVLLGDTEQTITTHYTVSNVGNDSGGNITFVTAPSSGVVVTLKRKEPLTQEIEYVENDDFPSDAHEEGLDRSVIRDQFLQEQIDRCIQLSAGATVSNLTFPDPTGDASKYLRVNATEDGYEHFDIASIGALSVSAFAETLIDDADAAEAQATLGLEIGVDVQEELSGASLASATVAGTDKVLIQDASDSDNLKTVTAQSIANLAPTGGFYKVDTRVHNLATASGSVAITGLGFTPKLVQLTINLDGAAGVGSDGFGDGSLGRCKYTRGGSIFAAAAAGVAEISSGNLVTFNVGSFISGGFTLSFVKTGAPTGTVAVSYTVFG